MVQKHPMLRARTVWLWILALACLSVGARNFELGLSMDAPLYATIARNIARTHQWFALQSNVPEFHPFAEHPHLGFWVEALAFKILPIADWSARVPGHLLYIAFLALFFFNVRRLSNQRVAILGVILLWSWYLFSNIFSSVLLDPGVLFFGSVSVFLWDLALRKARFELAAAAGASLALAGLYKGLTIAGFLPAWALLLIWHFRPRQMASGAIAVVSFCLVGLAYYLAVRASAVPNFFEVYWGNQVTHRFAQKWALGGFFSGEYWRKILQYTNLLAPLGLIALWRRRGLRSWLPLSLALGFIFLFSTNGLKGGQYLVTVLPWLAWLIAEGVDSLIALPLERLVPVTAWMGIGGTLLVQYLPLKTHAQGPLPEHREVRALVKHFGLEEMSQDFPIGAEPFFWPSQMAWYGDVRVSAYVGENVPAANPKSLFFQSRESGSEASALKAQRWCRHVQFTHGTLWVPCELLPKIASGVSDWRYDSSALFKELH